LVGFDFLLVLQVNNIHVLLFRSLLKNTIIFYVFFLYFSRIDNGAILGDIISVKKRFPGKIIKYRPFCMVSSIDGLSTGEKESWL